MTQPRRRSRSSRARLPTVAARMVRLPVARLFAQGGPAAELLATLQVDLAQLSRSDARLPASVLPLAWREAERLSGDPAFGVHACESFDLRALAMVHGPTDYLPIQSLAYSATLGEGLRRFARNWASNHDAARYEVQVRGDEARVVFWSDEPAEEAGASIEAALLLPAKALRELPARPVRLRGMHLRHARRGSAAELARFIDAPVRYGMPHNALVFAAADLDAPLTTALAPLLALVQAQADAELSRVGTSRRFADDVRQVLRESLGRREPTAAQTARRLHVSERTLMRRLVEEGTSHQALLDEVRGERARELLASGHKLADIAAELGYSERRSFQRAFKRWFGETPGRTRSR